MEYFGFITDRSSRSSWWEKSRRQCAENPGKVADKRACQDVQLSGQGRQEGVRGPWP